MRVAEFFKKIKANALQLVLPHLVAIYKDDGVDPNTAEQVATGIAIIANGRSALLTAKHALQGENFDEEPGDKSIFVSGALRLIGELRSHEVCFAAHDDLAILYVDEFSPKECLPSSCLTYPYGPKKAVTIMGYLLRDFHRDRKIGVLRPAPRTYTNSWRNYGDGYVALRYPKNRNRSTDSGLRVTAARPHGLSGGPMLDAEMLANGRVSIIGIFTEAPRELGIALGESSGKALSLISQM